MDKMEDLKLSPFGEGVNWWLNACVGSNGGPYNYLDYARGYFRAGHLITENIIENNGIGIDLYVYPILYLYRHAIELSIKHILSANTDGEIVVGHHLPTLWAKAEKVVIEIIPEEDGVVLESIKETISHFNEIDPIGETARFPEGRDGVIFWRSMRIINIEPIYHKVKICEDIFEWVSYLLSSKENFNQEMASYF